MAEKNSSKPMQVKKPVRTAKTPRAFPGQPAEEVASVYGDPVSHMLHFCDVRQVLQGLVGKEQSDYLTDKLRDCIVEKPEYAASVTPRGSLLLPQHVFLKLLKGELDAERTQEIIAQMSSVAARPDPVDLPLSARAAQTLKDFEAEIEFLDRPQVFVICDNPAYVRVVIAKFAIEELTDGSGILVAGAKIPDDQLVGFIRSLMTIAHRRGLVCHL